MDAAWVAWVVPSGLGALILASLAMAAESLFGPRRPEIASGLWWASLVRLALPPAVGSPIGWSVDVGEAASGVSGNGLIALWIGGVVLTGGCAMRRVLAERRQWSRRATRSIRPGTRRMAERCARALGLRTVPRVLAVDSGAACVGILTSWIALPRDLERSSRQRDLEVVLLHEFAHLKRRDGLRRAVVLAAQCVFWFHPAAWFAGRRLGVLAEIECDRLAASAARGGVVSCRSTLLAQARTWIERDAHVARAFVHPQSVLLSRLRALDGPRRPLRRTRIALTFLLGLACIGPAVRGLTPPPFDELDGCLQKRYAVYAALAQQQVDQASRE